MSARDIERIERTVRALREARLDAVVCALPSNVLLLSGYWPVVGTSIAVATREGAVGLGAPADESDLAATGWADTAERFVPGALDRLTPLIDVVMPALQRVLERLGVTGGRLGLEQGPMLEPSSYAGTNRYGTALRTRWPSAVPGPTLCPPTTCCSGCAAC